VLLGLYALLFAWVCAGFVTALMGFGVLLRGDPHTLSAASVARRPIRGDARTAIVMPICNEDVSVVVAGLRATLESLAATGGSTLFDAYLLSDTTDPQLRVDELAAWDRLRDELGDSARVYYRWRQRRTRRKAGNVADFLRRWGLPLPLHGRARRGQRDDRRLPAVARAPDGGAPARRHPADRPARLRAGDAACALAAVRGACGRTALHRRHAVLAARRVALLGAQRDPACRALHAALRARSAGRARRPAATTSCRTTSSRLR
jgi:hypothetical protein